MDIVEKYAVLEQSVKHSAALRLRRRLQPAGGAGDKVFPPTYEGGKYALETRTINGERLPCVLLDSVQSQANRMELALLRAARADRISLPLISVDFGAQGLQEIGIITSLDAPHRISDAILRDSLFDGTKFRVSTYGKYLDSASTSNASGLFEICPTALLFGMWDSTGPRGGMGVKFQRAIVSEIFAVNAELGVRTSSRIDPLQIQKNAGPLYTKSDSEWTLSEEEAQKDAKGLPVKWKKSGKPSEVNHGNIVPSLEENSGGVTIDYALQTTVISLPALRRLHFPSNGIINDVCNIAARATLAAMGLCGASLMARDDLDLRSRCLLIPEEPANWEILDGDGSSRSFDLTADEACELTRYSVDRAKEAGLAWREGELSLIPSDQLVTLVKRSRELAMELPPEEQGE